MNPQSAICLKVKRMQKKGKNQEKKNFNFFLFARFYTGRKNVTNENCLFYAKFFEFEVKS